MITCTETNQTNVYRKIENFWTKSEKDNKLEKCMKNSASFYDLIWDWGGRMDVNV